MGDSNAEATDKEREPIIVNSKEKSGKFYNQNVPIDILDVMLVPVLQYIPSFFLQLLIMGPVFNYYKKQKSAPSILYYVFDFVVKTHLSFFMVMVIDLFFFGTRNIMHLNYSTADDSYRLGYWVSVLLFLMIGIDIVKVVGGIWSIKADQFLINFHRVCLFVERLGKEEAEVEKRRKEKKFKIEDFYEIDHQATMEGISRNVHLMGFVLADYSVIDKRMEHKSVKLCIILQIFRLPVYQALMVTLQSAPGLNIFLCGLIELFLIVLLLHSCCIFGETWTRMRAIYKVIVSIGICSFLMVNAYMDAVSNETRRGIPVSLSIQQIAILVIVVLILIEYCFMAGCMMLGVLNSFRMGQLSTETRILKGEGYLRYRDIKIKDADDEVLPKEPGLPFMRATKAKIVARKFITNAQKSRRKRLDYEAANNNNLDIHRYHTMEQPDLRSSKVELNDSSPSSHLNKGKTRTSDQDTINGARKQMSSGS